MSSSPSNPQAYEQSSILLEKVVNERVNIAVNDIIDFMLSLDDKIRIYDNLVEEITLELEKSSFMVDNFELSEPQKKSLRNGSTEIVRRAYDKFRVKIIKSDRERTHIEHLEEKLKQIIEESVVAVGNEVNRGAVVPSAVAKCDISNPEKKKIELHYSNNTRITVPTNGFFVSSNCIQILRDSVIFLKREKNDVTETTK